LPGSAPATLSRLPYRYHHNIFSTITVVSATPLRHYLSAPFYMSELRDRLARLGLAHYFDVFVTEGFDTWETVLDITESDLYVDYWRIMGLMLTVP
jgi:hypothetical protein